MPSKAPHPCAYPRCPNLTTERYCSEHKTIASREYQKLRDPATTARYGSEWRRIRNRYISRHPLCERCEQEGRLTPATEVHHIAPLADAGTNDDENLMSVCKSCHAILDENHKNFRS